MMCGLFVEAMLDADWCSPFFHFHLKWWFERVLIGDTGRQCFVLVLCELCSVSNNLCRGRGHCERGIQKDPSNITIRESVRRSLRDTISYSGSYNELYTKHFGEHNHTERGRNRLNDGDGPRIHSFPGLLGMSSIHDNSWCLDVHQYGARLLFLPNCFARLLHECNYQNWPSAPMLSSEHFFAQIASLLTTN